MRVVNLTDMKVSLQLRFFYHLANLLRRIEISSIQDHLALIDIILGRIYFPSLLVVFVIVPLLWFCEFEVPDDANSEIFLCFLG